MMAKTPDDYTQIKFRPGAGSQMEKTLSERTEQQTNITLSQIARRDLERYYVLLSRSLPTFSEQEATVLVNALNGSRNKPETVHLLWAEIDEQLEEYPAEGVNRGAFVARLRNFSRLECMAIADAVERFWLGSYSKSAEETGQRLREVGLIR